jgi:uncharacterized membrane protein
MKQKLVTFVIGFLCYGFVFGLMMYFIETNKSVRQAFYSALFFGTSMGLFEVFVNPKIRAYFKNRKNTKL